MVVFWASGVMGSTLSLAWLFLKKTVYSWNTLSMLKLIKMVGWNSNQME